MGVWIETKYLTQHSNFPRVTPFVGVWIETVMPLPNEKQIVVTPFVGVWIETKTFCTFAHGEVRHTLRGCVD